MHVSNLFRNFAPTKTNEPFRTRPNGKEGAKIMVQNIVNSINTWQDWYKFSDKVKNSETYKHSFFVYADCFNEGEKHNEILLCKGLTEDEAKRIYEVNKYGVENNGTDYAEIYYENLYEPVGNNPWVYQRATGERVAKAFELHEIYKAVREKLNKNTFLIKSNGKLVDTANTKDELRKKASAYEQTIQGRYKKEYCKYDEADGFHFGYDFTLFDE